MKVFYAARVCRPDLLRAITFLACTMTKWSADCDRRLHRLMCYVHSTRHHVQVGWIGDPKADLRMHLYSDADFAGCQSTNRCTSGVFLALEGPNSSFPIASNCKKQHQTCYATAESESVAGCYALRTNGLPGLVLWETLNKRNTIVQPGGAVYGVRCDL